LVIYGKNYGEERWCGGRNFYDFVQILQRDDRTQPDLEFWITQNFCLFSICSQMLLRVLTRCIRSPQGPFSIQHHQRLASSVRPKTTSTPLPEVVFADPHAPSRFPPGSNKHISVNAEGIKLVDLEFVEEPLGVTAEQGHGYLRVEFGDAIGPDKRYKIVRKLGWGMNSSIWMAFDEKYVLNARRTHVILTTSTGKRNTSRSKL